MDRKDPTVQYQALDYYTHNGDNALVGMPMRRSGLRASLQPCLYVLVGVLLGWMASPVASLGFHRPATDSHEFRWLRSPMRWWGRKDASPITQLYDAAQTARFLKLRQRIDEEFDSQLNAVETPDATVVAYSPFRLSFELLARIDEEFDRFLRDLTASSPAGGAGPIVFPTFDVQDTEAELLITCTVPALKPGQVMVDLQGQLLLVSLQDVRTDDAVHTEAHFSRGFVVPEGVTAKDVSASVEGDALRMVVRKPTAAAEVPQAILIQSHDS